MSYIYKQHQPKNFTPLKLNSNEINLKDQKRTNTDSLVINRNYNNENNENNFDDLERKNQTDDSATMSPISSTNSAALSPHQQINIAPANQQQIPTRYIDRRTSTSAIPTDPHKFNVNYSTAGQKLARKAQELIKSVEISKDSVKKDAEQTNIKSIVNDNQASDNGNGSGSGSGGGSINEDWQNVN